MAWTYFTAPLATDGSEALTQAMRNELFDALAERGYLAGDTAALGGWHANNAALRASQLSHDFLWWAGAGSKVRLFAEIRRIAAAKYTVDPMAADTMFSATAAASAGNTTDVIWLAAQDMGLSFADFQTLEAAKLDHPQRWNLARAAIRKMEWVHGFLPATGTSTTWLSKAGYAESHTPDLDEAWSAAEADWSSSGESDIGIHGLFADSWLSLGSIYDAANIETTRYTDHYSAAPSGWKTDARTGARVAFAAEGASTFERDESDTVVLGAASGTSVVTISMAGESDAAALPYPAARVYWELAAADYTGALDLAVSATPARPNDPSGPPTDSKRYSHITLGPGLLAYYAPGFTYD